MITLFSKEPLFFVEETSVLSVPYQRPVIRLSRTPRYPFRLEAATDSAWWRVQLAGAGGETWQGLRCIGHAQSTRRLGVMGIGLWQNIDVKGFLANFCAMTPTHNDVVMQGRWKSRWFAMLVLLDFPVDHFSGRQ